MKFDAKIDIYGDEKTSHDGVLEFLNDGGQIFFDGGEIAFCDTSVCIKKSEYVLNLAQGTSNDFCISLPEGSLKGQVFCKTFSVAVKNKARVMIRAEYDLIFDGFTKAHKIMIKAQKI